MPKRFFFLSICLSTFLMAGGCLPSPVNEVSTTLATGNSSTSTLITASSATPVSTQAESFSEYPIMPIWNLLADDFNSGTLSKWNLISPGNLKLEQTGGRDNSAALEVHVHKRETYLYRTDALKATEAYLTFWFNPNQVEIQDQPDVPIPGKSIRIVDFKGLSEYTVVAGLRIWKPASSNSYRVFLEWEDQAGSHFDLDEGQFDLTGGWQKITLGYKINEWIAIWVDDRLMRKVSPVNHAESFGEIIEIGKTNDDSVVIPNGSMLYDDIALQIPRITDLWVDAAAGSDQNKGVNRSQALQSIQKAADLAGPGTAVHILPGTYRESIDPARDGTDQDTVLYRAEEGSGTVHIMGSVSSKMVKWQALTSNTIGLPDSVDPTKVYYADLSFYGLKQAPRFVIEVNGSGDADTRLPLAREPDVQVRETWKQHEFWWSAEGGASKATCDPATNANADCDRASRSMTYLTDLTDDLSPEGIEKGNLTSLGDLVGATLVAIDTVEGHYVYRRTIVSQDIQSGRIGLDSKCEFDEGSNDPGLGWGTKYYVEGKANLLDSPGEWWYDSASGLIYLWPVTDGNPGEMNIEISVRENGFRLSHRSNIHLDGLALQFFNGNAVSLNNEPENGSRNIVLSNLTLEYANHGILLFQATGDDPTHIISGFAIKNSEITQMDSDAINMSYTWPGESAPLTFVFAGITDTLIQNNAMHDIGFRSDSDSSRGVSIQHADRVTFEGNHIYDVAHNGVQFSYAVDQANKAFGFAPDEIKTGGILVKDNLFERTCELTTDCGGLKFWGDPPHSHVYRDVLITGNTFRNIVGWSSIAVKRKLWSGGTGSSIKGMGGFGLYVDMASGLYVFRNVSYNNSYADFFTYGVWRDGEMIFANNVAANSLKGIRLGGVNFETHGNVNTQLIDNILINNEDTGLWISENGSDASGLTIDHNLYFNNGWGFQNETQTTNPDIVTIEKEEGQTVSYASMADLQTAAAWEVHGIEGNPGFTRFDLNTRDLFSSITPDFHLIQGSIAVDKGVQVLPGSLLSLLDLFGIHDARTGLAVDIGRFEAGTLTGN